MPRGTVPTKVKKNKPIDLSGASKGTPKATPKGTPPFKELTNAEYAKLSPAQRVAYDKAKSAQVINKGIAMTKANTDSAKIRALQDSIKLTEAALKKNPADRAMAAKLAKYKSDLAGYMRK